MGHRTQEELAAGVEAVRSSPADDGVVELIVARPAVGERAVLERAELTVDEGVAGDTWRERRSRHTADGSAEAARQVTIMNACAVDLVAAGDRSRWALAGDQLYLDLDISDANLPAGTRLAIGGTAVLEVSPEPHTGCAKFAARFGKDAARFVNSPVGRALRLRGVNARVVVPGPVAVGDRVRVTRSG